ncbi:hypothetical protein DPPLL_22130 [Desulfofustis limnaeus]|uniref:Uncharacterized protein n=2 Tax=Desulfofustis limnaeus TaxID=2740163 RepID=A0ABN6M4N0_9BACT|nr:hypothetical protein DPPLL_22130 [Desulfofustis limnaeus]
MLIVPLCEMEYGKKQFEKRVIFPQWPYLTTLEFPGQKSNQIEVRGQDKDSPVQESGRLVGVQVLIYGTLVDLVGIA